MLKKKLNNIAVIILTLSIAYIGCATQSKEKTTNSAAYSLVQRMKELGGYPIPCLVKKMDNLGINYSNTGKIALVSDEAWGIGSLEISDQDIIQEIWDTIFLSSPYQLWYASGYLRIEFYSYQDDKPVATLFLNESGSAFLEGDSDRDGIYNDAVRYRCPGLLGLVMKLYCEEKEAEQGGE